MKLLLNMEFNWGKSKSLLEGLFSDPASGFSIDRITKVKRKSPRKHLFNF
jgi:hypothetical protein